jgi:hypothetical protein
LIPATVPLSSKVEVPKVVGDVKRARNPFSPPVIPEPPVIPNDDVEVHMVEAPLERSTCPTVPTLLAESLKNPVRVRSRTVASVIVVVAKVLVPVATKAEVVAVPNVA